MQTENNTILFAFRPVIWKIKYYNRISFVTYIGKGNIEMSNLFNPLRMKSVCFISGLRSYRAVNTLRFGYKNQSVIDV